MATLSFGGCSMVRTNPNFFDQCGMVSDIADGQDWEKIGRLTVHISPDSGLQSLRATVAWRNEVFAHLFPIDENHIGIGENMKHDEAAPYFMKAWSMEPEAWTVVKSKILELLRLHLERSRERSVNRIRSVSEALSMLNGMS